MKARNRVRLAKKIAAATALGGGGIGMLTGASIGVIVAEAKLARRAIPPASEKPPSSDGVYGDFPGVPLRLAMIGDSTAAGFGVHAREETPAALLAYGLSEIAGRPVDVVNVARVGARSDRLDEQIDEVLAAGRAPDVTVMMIGANDVTHRVNPRDSVRHLGAAVRRLMATGSEVVVGTCPDLGTIEPIAQPLRYLARRWSRRLAAMQTVAVVSAGGRTVSIGALLGPEFAAQPRDMFGPDRFHPSARGYAAASMAVLPTVAAAVGYWPAEERPELGRGEGLLPVALAAVEAAEDGGTEVGPPSDARPGGPGRFDPRTAWALLRHRRRRPLPEPSAGTSGDETEHTAPSVPNGNLMR